MSNALKAAHVLDHAARHAQAQGPVFKPCYLAECVRHKAFMSNADRRYSENALLPLLSILTTASQFRGPEEASQPTKDWMPAFQKATAAVEGLLQRLQLECTSKAQDVHQCGGNVCQLAQAVLSAISVLRKRLHSVATSKLSGAVTGESFLAVRQSLTACSTHWMERVTKHVHQSGMAKLD